MNKFMQLGAALGGAALVVAAGSAYTASNTMTANPLMGWGEQTASGVAPTSTEYTYSEAGALMELDKVIYNVPAMADFENVTASLTVGGTESLDPAITTDCTPITATKITCDNAGVAFGYLVDDVETIALTVKQSSTT